MHLFLLLLFHFMYAQNENSNSENSVCSRSPTFYHMAYLKAFMASLHFLLSKIYDAENLPQ